MLNVLQQNAAIALVLTLLATACSSAATEAPVSVADATPATDARPQPVPGADLTPFCGAPVVPPSAHLNSHTDLVTFLNALPRPLTLPCAVAALPRPIGIRSTDSAISLQPAMGRANPRIFLRTGTLVMSLGLAGDFSTHLETAEFEEQGYSVKGDLPFPQTAAVEEKFFFASIARQTGSVCGLCHAGERASRTVDGVPAFTSRALQPVLSQLVSLDTTRGLAEACEFADSSLRCQLLRALFRLPAEITDMQFLPGTGTLLSF